MSNDFSFWRGVSRGGIQDASREDTAEAALILFGAENETEAGKAGNQIKYRIGCRLQAAAANSVYVRLYHSALAISETHQLRYYLPASYLPKSWKSNPSGWPSSSWVTTRSATGCVSATATSVSPGCLRCGFLLGLFSAFFLPGTFFLALGKGCTRASCHNPQSSLDVVNLIDFLSKRFNVHR